MNQYRISEDTVSDLDGIWNYIAQDNIDAANHFLDAIFLKFSSLAAMPHMGKSREEFAPRLRSFPVGSYVIFYRPVENGVEIVRV